MNAQEVWMQFALSAVQGTAGSVLDNPASNAIAIADEMLEGMMQLQERMSQRASGQIAVPRVVPPQNMRGAR